MSGQRIGIAGAGLLGVALAHSLFAQALFHNYDLTPTADLLQRLEAATAQGLLIHH
mgnify:CR=1 FL=1